MRNVIFDFGKVLVEFNPHLLYDAVFGGDVEKAEWFHQNITVPSFYDRIDRGDDFAECIRDLQALHPDYAEQIALYDTHYHDMVGNTMPGMMELLTELKAHGYGLYGLTNWSYKVYDVMKKYPIFSLLDGCVISSEEHLIKPDLRIYQCLVDRFHLQPSECVFVDDKQTNVDAAKACGMHSLLFTHADQLRCDFQQMGVL
jgi:epoxide hydrolase-like predicted phosphatase